MYFETTGLNTPELSPSFYTGIYIHVLSDKRTIFYSFN